MATHVNINGDLQAPQLASPSQQKKPFTNPSSNMKLDDQSRIVLVQKQANRKISVDQVDDSLKQSPSNRKNSNDRMFTTDHSFYTTGKMSPAVMRAAQNFNQQLQSSVVIQNQINSINVSPEQIQKAQIQMMPSNQGNADLKNVEVESPTSMNRRKSLLPILNIDRKQVEEVESFRLKVNRSGMQKANNNFTKQMKRVSRNQTIDIDMPEKFNESHRQKYDPNKLNLTTTTFRTPRVSVFTNQTNGADQNNITQASMGFGQKINYFKKRAHSTFAETSIVQMQTLQDIQKDPSYVISSNVQLDQAILPATNSNQTQSVMNGSTMSIKQQLKLLGADSNLISKMTGAVNEMNSRNDKKNSTLSSFGGKTQLNKKLLKIHLAKQRNKGHTLVHYTNTTIHQSSTQFPLANNIQTDACQNLSKDAVNIQNCTDQSFALNQDSQRSINDSKRSKYLEGASPKNNGSNTNFPVQSKVDFAVHGESKTILSYHRSPIGQDSAIANLKNSRTKFEYLKNIASLQATPCHRPVPFKDSPRAQKWIKKDKTPSKSKLDQIEAKLPESVHKIQARETELMSDSRMEANYPKDDSASKASKHHSSIMSPQRKETLYSIIHQEQKIDDKKTLLGKSSHSLMTNTNLPKQKESMPVVVPFNEFQQKYMFGSNSKSNNSKSMSKKRRGSFGGENTPLLDHTSKVSFDGNGGGIISPKPRDGGSNQDLHVIGVKSREFYTISKEDLRSPDDRKITTTSPAHNASMSSTKKAFAVNKSKPTTTGRNTNKVAEPADQQKVASLDYTLKRKKNNKDNIYRDDQQLHEVSHTPDLNQDEMQKSLEGLDIQQVVIRHNKPGLSSQQGSRESLTDGVNIRNPLEQDPDNRMPNTILNMLSKKKILKLKQNHILFDIDNEKQKVIGETHSYQPRESLQPDQIHQEQIKTKQKLRKQPMHKMMSKTGDGFWMQNQNLNGSTQTQQYQYNQRHVTPTNLELIGDKIRTEFHLDNDSEFEDDHYLASQGAAYETTDQNNNLEDSQPFRNSKIMSIVNDLTKNNNNNRNSTKLGSVKEARRAKDQAGLINVLRTRKFSQQARNTQQAGMRTFHLPEIRLNQMTELEQMIERGEKNLSTQGEQKFSQHGEVKLSSAGGYTNI